MTTEIKGKVVLETDDATKSLDKFADKAKKSSDGIGASFGALKGVIGAAVAFLAAGEIVDFLQAGVDSAIAQQDALRGLEQQLALTGEASQAALDGFAEFANVMEATTGIGDDVILNQLALAKSFGVSNDQATELVKAATELSAVTGKSLEASVRTLGKSLSGTLGPLDDSIDAMKGLTKAELENGEAIRVVLDRYGGTAAAKLETFSGAITRAQNSFGNFQESIGEVIVNSPALTAAIGEVADLFADLEAFVKDNQETLNSWIVNGIIGASVALTGLIDVLQFVGTGVAGIGVAIQVAQTIWTNTIGAMVGQGLKLLEFVGVLDEDAKKSFDAFNQSVSDTAAGFTDGVVSMVQKGDDLKTGIEKATTRILDAEGKQKTSIKNLEGARADASKRGVTDAAAIAKATEEAGKIEAEVRKTNESAIDAEIRKREELLAKIQKNVIDGGLSEAQAAALRIELADKTNAAILALNTKAVEDGKELAKKAAEDQRAVIQAAAANPIEFVIKGGDLNASTAAAIGVGITSSVLEGAEGARKLLAQGAGAIADTFLPGIGGAVSSLTEQLSRGPEENKAMVKAFVEALPDLITAIAESMPVIVEALVDSLINEGGIVKIAIALAKAFAGEAIFKAIGEQIGLSFGEAFTATNIGGTIRRGFEEGVAKLAAGITQIPVFISQGAQILGEKITSGFFNAVGPITEALAAVGDTILAIINTPIEAFRSILGPLQEPFNQFSRAVTRLSAVGQVISNTPAWIKVLFDGFQKVADFFSDIFDFGGNGGFLGTGIGAATGITEVPPGFPNDTFPARLTSGERVVPAKTNQDLIEFLDGGGDNGKLDTIAALLAQIAAGMANGGGGTSEITLKIDGRTLAKEMVNIDRRNLRTTA